MALLLESLPPLVLERICETLCAAAAARRFCQVNLRTGGGTNGIETPLKRWTDVLGPGARYRYVRRLKISTAEEKTEDGGSRVEDEDWNWNVWDYFDVHDFCQPFAIYQDTIRTFISPHSDQDWLALARFIGLLPALKDLIWAYGHLPGCILSAAHKSGCRLHIHHFFLPSLIQPRDSPRPIDPDEYALATSPSLSSVVVRVGSFETGGEINHIEDALIRMVAGAAPYLEHVLLVPSDPGSGLALDQAVRLGKPRWDGFFPGTAEADEDPRPGRLRSLVFSDGYRLDAWRHLIDFTNLRRLSIYWGERCGHTLTDAATRGDFQSLDTLELREIEDETEQGQEVLHRFLKSVPPLRRLSLSAYVSDKTFKIILDHHSRALCNLSVASLYRDEELQNPLAVFSAATVQQLAEQCPNLERLRLPINRTRGDREEMGIYRALDRLSRLKRLWLTLKYSIGPDEELWDEERDGEHPLLSLGFADELDIPPKYIAEAFSNSALDATLALSIFNVISSGNKLPSLRLEMDLKGPNVLRRYYSNFHDILRWFSRSWTCEQDLQGNVTVNERDRVQTVRAGREWEEYVRDEKYSEREKVYEKVFKELWPPRTAKWWNDWESLPLSLPDD